MSGKDIACKTCKRRCFSPHQQTKELEIECPNCKAKHGGFDTISEIKTNPNVNQILEFYEEFTTTKPPGSNGKLCPCNEVAKYSCLRCTTCCCKACYKNVCKWCAFGKEAHEKPTKNKHIFVGVKDTGEAICKVHELPLDYYCAVCKVTLCLDCHLASHRDHHTKTADSVWKEATELSGELKSWNDDSQTNWKAVNNSADRVLQQVAKNERKALQQLQKEQAKIQGLVSLLFEEASKHYKHVFAKEKESVIEKVAQRKYTEDAMKHFCPEDISTTRLCLVSCMREMSDMLKCLQKESKDLKKLKSYLHLKEQRILKSSLRINEQEIFKSILELFGSIRIDRITSECFQPSSVVKLETFVNGDFEQKIADNTQLREVPQEDYVHQSARSNILFEEPSSDEEVCLRRLVQQRLAKTSKKEEIEQDEDPIDEKVYSPQRLVTAKKRCKPSKARSSFRY